MVEEDTKERDGELAWNVVNLCLRKGLMMFAPVGFGGGFVKIRFAAVHYSRNR